MYCRGGGGRKRGGRGGKEGGMRVPWLLTNPPQSHEGRGVWNKKVLLRVVAPPPRSVTGWLSPGWDVRETLPSFPLYAWLLTVYRPCGFSFKLFSMQGVAHKRNPSGFCCTIFPSIPAPLIFFFCIWYLLYIFILCTFTSSFCMECA